MRKLGLQAVVSLSVAGIAFACAAEPPEDFVPPENAPDRSSSSSGSAGEGGASSSGGSSGGSSSSGSSGSTDAASDGAVTGNCANHAPVSDKPACDTCSKNKCCTQIQACDKSPSCKIAQDCIAKCPSNDIGCGFDCYVAAGDGAELLSDVGACASSQCGNECGGGGGPDGGFDFDF